MRLCGARVTRPGVTLLMRPPAWLGGGTHLRQMADVVRGEFVPGDRVVQVGSLRGSQADIRLPFTLLKTLPPTGLRALGAVLWRGASGVHRASIDIPPARDELLSVLDLAPRHFTDEGTLPGALGAQVQQARGVVVSTYAVADEVAAELGAERVWLLPPAVEDRFHMPVAASSRSTPYLLHVGGATHRKGLDILACAWPAIRDAYPDLQLVLVGPPHPSGRAALLSQPGVRYLGQVNDDDALTLMAHAAAVLVPSRYEGFGMPVAEALTLGTPVAVVAGTAPAEVGGDVAYAADPMGGAEAFAEATVAAACARETEPGRLRQGCVRARRWSIDSIREQQLQIYEEAFG